MQAVEVAAASDDDAFSSTIVIPTIKPAPETQNDPIPESTTVSPVPIAEENAATDSESDLETSLSISEDTSKVVDDLPDEEEDDLSATPLISETAAEPAEPLQIAERLTGSVGLISGRFDPPSADEIVEEAQDSDPLIAQPESREESEAVIELEEGLVTPAEPMSEVEDTVDPDTEPASDEPNVIVDDVPTPILLSNHEIEDAVDRLGDADLDDSAFDISKPENVAGVTEDEPRAPVFGAAVIPSLMSVGVETELDPDSVVHEQPERPELDAELPANVEEEIDEETAEESEVIQPSISETESSVDTEGESDPIAPIADTGEGLAYPVESGGTSPNIGSTDTDGRRSGLKPLAEGTVLNNRYDIVRKIGGGGMGAVYLACDRNLGGVQRAVKEMVQSHIEEEQQEKAVEDFKRESMILSTLDHPSIPTIYDYFFDATEGRFYLVMKYISGGDLAGKLRSTPEGRIDERIVTEWALQIIDVLDYLHNLPTKIVYRDLKPSNVMIDGNTGRVMLIDFGIARSINQNQEKGVTAVGTMGYAPPELFSGNVEPRSDIYSLGSTMFHLLTGADPQNNPLLIFDFQKNPRPRQINPQLSDQIERILMRSVEYNAEARFASAAEMKLALTTHLDNLRSGQITYGVTEVPQSVSLSHQIVFCGFCGQRIVATDMFCAFCGSKQPLAQHGVHREVYSHAVGTARLVIEGTSDLTAPAYALEKNENLVGRRDPMSNIFPEVDLSKFDPQTKISRRHAKIWRDGTNFMVEDLGSSNGTLLLSKVSDTLRLQPHRPHPLASGDRIRIGDTTLQFLVG